MRDGWVSTSMAVVVRFVLYQHRTIGTSMAAFVNNKVD